MRVMRLIIAGPQQCRSNSKEGIRGGIFRIPLLILFYLPRRLHGWMDGCPRKVPVLLWRAQHSKMSPLNKKRLRCRSHFLIRSVNLLPLGCSPHGRCHPNVSGIPPMHVMWPSTLPFLRRHPFLVTSRMAIDTCATIRALSVAPQLQ